MKISELEVDVIKNANGDAVLELGASGQIWTSANDGVGSGLDADVLQGKPLPEIEKHAVAMAIALG